MKLSGFKITSILAILSLIWLSSCRNDEFDTSLIFDEQGNFRYKKETTFCQRNPEKEISSKTFSYDKNGNVIKEVISYIGIPEIMNKREFNESSQQLTDSTFYYRSDEWQYQNSTRYIYSRNLLSEKHRYNSDGTLSHKIIYKYIGSKLRWEEFWYFNTNEWKFQYAHGFEFDRSGRLVKKESFQDEAKKNVYDTFVYAYKNGRLYEEKRIIRTGKTSFVKKYFYTAKGFIDEITEDGKVVEKNFYELDRLIEKHTFYYGIDPGFSPCGGNFIYKYEY
ncbi:hypothetical protein [Mariniphaga sp.]|uniref:hypothetical protein n=1 Tax=Mariniphaga sp. TaxID=1954475 RepID=UPI0035677947